jgi:hypothetical protein
VSFVNSNVGQFTNVNYICNCRPIAFVNDFSLSRTVAINCISLSMLTVDLFTEYGKPAARQCKRLSLAPHSSVSDGLARLSRTTWDAMS